MRVHVKWSSLMVLLFTLALLNNNNIYAQCNLNLNVGNDTTVTCGSQVTFSAPSGLDIYDWSTGGTSNSITVSQADTYMVTVTEFSGNVVTNGDFSSGYTGFTSSYTVGTGGSWGQLSNAGTYAITSNSNLVHTNFVSCYDHTVGNTTGSMLVVNGSGVAGQAIWQQTITVAPNTTYAFETWGMSVTSSNPAQLAFSINGTQIGSVFNLSTNTCNWQQFYVTWNSGTNTTANISIVNQNIASGGNDFALDDISFSTVCEYYDTAVVSNFPIFLAVDTVWLCRGDSVDLGASLTNAASCTQGAFQWSPSTGLNSTSAQSPIFTAQQTQTTTTYIMDYSDVCGCDTTDTIVAMISDIQEPTSTMTKLLCGANDGQIDINPQGGFPSYQYSIDSGTTYQTSSVFTNLSIGYYDFLVQDSLGCISPFHVDTVIDPNSPNIDSIVTQNVSCFSANNGEIEIVTTGGTSPLEFSIDSGLTFQNSPLFQQLNYGDYWIFVHDANGCEAIPQMVTIGTNQALFYDSAAVHDLHCFQDSTGSLEVFAHGGTPPLSYSIDNGSSFQYGSLFDSLLANSYVVIVQDSFGCQTTPQILQVSEPSALLAQLDITDDTCYQNCGGFASVTASGGIAPYQYNWFGFGPNSTSTNNLCAGNYQFEVTDNMGCVTHIDYAIQEPDELIFDSIVIDNMSCNGVEDGLINPYVSGGVSPYYFSIDGGNSYSQSPYFSGLSAGTYQISVSDSGYRCSQSTEVYIIEPGPVVLETPFNEKQICITNCINLTANASGGVGGYQYHWSASNSNNSMESFCPQNDTVYAVFASDSDNCISNVEMIAITFFDSLYVDVSPDDSICRGEELEIYTAYSGGNQSSGYNFRWTPQLNIDNPYSPNPTVSPTQTTQYILAFSDGCGTPTVYDTIQVEVLDGPVPTYILLSDRTGCEPFTVEIENTTDSIQMVEWFVGDVKGYGNTFVVEDLKSGVYNFKQKVTDWNGCVGLQEFDDYFIVNPKPIADFNLNPNTTSEFNTTVKFYNQSYGDIVSYLWDFSGLDSSSLINPEYKFPADTGLYPVTLTVETDSGCVDQYVDYVKITPEFNFYIPNAFTPNDDILNDEFKPVAIGMDLSNYDFRIFDRWGKQVFHSNNIEYGWDGSVANESKTAIDGVYVWKITLSAISNPNDLREYIGKVHLIR